MLAAIVCRVRGDDGTVPLVAAYDYHERVFSPPLPILFQKRAGTENRPVNAPAIRKLLDTALAATGLTGADGKPLRFVTHDFRRLFVTDASTGCRRTSPSSWSGTAWMRFSAPTASRTYR